MRDQFYKKQRRGFEAPDETALLRPILHPRGEQFVLPPVDREVRDHQAVIGLPLENLKARDPAEILTGHRPEKAEGFYQPRTISVSLGRRLRRFNGKKVRPAGNSTQLFGGDDRKILYDRSWPWRCVGRLDHPGHWGTASLVGRRTVLTAAHVLPWGNLWKHPINFVPAYVNGTSAIDVSFKASVNAVAYWETVTDDVCGYDMAVCRLDRPLGDDLGYFGARTYVDDWEDMAVFATVGYAHDVASAAQPAVETGVAVDDDDSDDYGTLEVETKADTSSGMSGGPLFATWNGDVQIIGARSGWEEEFSYSFPLSFTDEHALFAGGNGLVRLIRWARENWEG